MKKFLLAIFVLTACISQAQITLTSANFAQPGDTIFYGVDSIRSSSSLGTTNGVNKTWDFSGAGKQTTSESVFSSPLNSPIPAPPGISHVLIEDGDLQNVVFMSVTQAGVQTVIPNPVPFGGEPFIYLKSITFPLNYLTRTRDTTISSFVLPASLLQIPLFDSVRITLTIKLDVLCDGWGTLKTPTGTYNSLRLKQSTITDFKFEGGLPNPLNPTKMIWTPIPISSLPIDVPSNQLDVSYIWLSENSKYFLAEATMVTDTANVQETFRYQIPRPINSGLFKNKLSLIETQVYPNPAKDVLNIEANLSAKQNYNITLTDINGKVLSSFGVIGNQQNKITLPTDNLRDGLYFVRIVGSDSQATVKFSVNR